MARRKRNHIPPKQKLAAALAMLLPQSERDILRAAHAPAKSVMARFEFHHVVPHCPPFNGSDSWWNLDAMPKRAHRARSKGLMSDTSIIAKVKRLRQAFVVAAGKPKPRKGSSAGVDGKRTTGLPIKRKRKIYSRPFPKKHRPLRQQVNRWPLNGSTAEPTPS